MPEGARPEAGVVDGAVAAGTRRVDAPGLVAVALATAVAGRHAGVLAPVAGAYAGALVPAVVGAVVGLAVAPALDGRGALCLLEHAVQTPAARVLARVT